MTRVKISLGILAAIIAVSIFSGVWVNRKCLKMINDTNRIAEFIEADDMENARSTAENLESEWNSFYKTASVILRGEKLTEAERIVFRIENMIKYEKKEIIPQISELLMLFDNIRKSEIPSLNTIF